ncbi:MAG: replicative DNA helicase [Deltaproteobacteria bacterium]|nr:replicative DNA helicase [Deltaproteobacteria bacterium]
MSNVQPIDEHVVQGSSLKVVSSHRHSGRVPPHSLDAEQSVLGAVLLDNEVVNAAIELLEPEDFYQRAHKILFQVMLELAERQEPIDIVTLTESLRMSALLDSIGGIEYLSKLVDVVPTSANVEYYARIVKEMSLRRKVISASSEIATAAYGEVSDVDDFLDEAEQKIFAVSESRVKSGFVRVSDIVKESIKQVEQRYVSKEALTGVASGFAELDKLTSGFQESDLIIIAGRPSMGKTSLALSIAQHIAIEQAKTVALFSLEMSKQQITTRLLCSEARVSSSRVRSGKLGESDFPRLVDAASEITNANIFIDDTAAISALEMRAKARRLYRQNPFAVMIIDYLQLMRVTNKRTERREQEIAIISASLKSLAKELNVPIIALSQLNRSVEGRQDKRPLMSDLRESGAIEQDADIIAFVYRDEVYHPDTQDKGVAELIIAKHRNGPIGTVRLAFIGEYTIFENLAEDADYDYLGEDLDLPLDVS